MMEFDVKSWDTNGGWKITRVDATAEKEEEIEEFDIESFKTNHPDIYNLYLKTKIVKSSAKSGFAKITKKKEKK